MAEFVEIDLGEGGETLGSRRLSPRRRPVHKVQAQVPVEWRQKIVALAHEHAVPESDVVRTLLSCGLYGTTLDASSFARRKHMPKKKVDIAELEPLLATQTDDELAARFSVSSGRIRQLRVKLTGASARRRSKYDALMANPEFVAALNGQSDETVAEAFGLRRGAVAVIRKTLGVPTYSEIRRAQLIPLLGTASDKVLAERFGFSLAGVFSIRRRLKIPQYVAPPGSRRRNKEATEKIPVEVAPAVVELVPTQKFDGDIEFLQRRYQAGDSTEALAARLEMPEEQVKSLLGLSA